MSGKYRILWQLLVEQKNHYLAACGAMLLATLFLFLAPLIPGAVISSLLADDPDAVSPLLRWVVEGLGGREQLQQRLGLAGLCVVLATGLGGAFNYWRGRFSAQGSESIARKLRDRLYNHLQHLPAGYHDRTDAGDLVQRCTSDVDTLLVFLSTQVVEIAHALVMLGVAFPLMWSLDRHMAMVAVVLLPLVFGFSFFYFRTVQSTFLKVDEAEGSMSARLQENLSGIRVVRAFARQGHEQRLWEERIGEFRDLQMRLMRQLAMYWGFSDLLCGAQICVLLVYGANRVAHQTLPVGELFVFLAYLGLFLWPLRHIARVLTEMGKALVAIRRIQEILDAPLETNPPVEAGQAQALPQRGHLVFDRVSFTHGQHPVLHDVSFTVQPGQTVALLGPSGSGKSTLMHLLLRLYDPDSGRIVLEGQPIGAMERKAVRSRIGTVMQEPFLYSRTIRDNIKMGRPEATDAEMIAMAQAASIHGAIQALPLGYDTMLGERGVNLSGGQRQRVALARALLAETPVLILDDALSAVDTETEEAILAALQQRRGRSTTLLIAHRLSSVQHADRILVLEAGRIVQRGTHESLLREEGRYRRLWQIQTALEDELEADLQPALAAH